MANTINSGVAALRTLESWALITFTAFLVEPLTI